MSQLYAESGVKRKDTAGTMGIRALLVLGVVVGIILMLMGGVIGIVGIVLAIVMVFIFPKLNIEYEYVFVDGQIDFDRIIGKAKRKTVLRLDMEQMEVIAPLGSHALDGYTYTQSIKKDFSSRDKNSKPFVIIASDQEKKYYITFEPNEKMITVMKSKSPRKVILL
ncbi:MAG: DUF6106 family protein [Mobilitalea sp.]